LEAEGVAGVVSERLTRYAPIGQIIGVILYGLPVSGLILGFGAFAGLGAGLVDRTL
jgi:hypothetical protein